MWSGVISLIKHRIRWTYAGYLQNNEKARGIKIQAGLSDSGPGTNIPGKNIAVLNPQTIIPICMSISRTLLIVRPNLFERPPPKKVSVAPFSAFGLYRKSRRGGGSGTRSLRSRNVLIDKVITEPDTRREIQSVLKRRRVTRYRIHWSWMGFASLSQCRPSSRPYWINGAG